MHSSFGVNFRQNAYENSACDGLKGKIVFKNEKKEGIIESTMAILDFG
jgi:hypothetical protein